MAYKARLADINDKGVYFYVYTGNRRLFLFEGYNSVFKKTLNKN